MSSVGRTTALWLLATVLGSCAPSARAPATAPATAPAVAPAVAGPIASGPRLSQATHRVLASLTPDTIVRAYFSTGLPPRFAKSREQVDRLLGAYREASEGRLQTELVDPEAFGTGIEEPGETRRDIFGRQIRESTPLERRLEKLGIPPLAVQVMEEDKVSIRHAYMGIAVESPAGHVEVIPVVESADLLEYELSVALWRVALKERPKLGLVVGDGSLDPDNELSRIREALEKRYELVTLKDPSQIGDDIRALIVLGPKTPFPAPTRRALAKFVFSGRSAAFLLDNVKVDLTTLRAESAEHGLDELLSRFGLRTRPGLIVDARCATIAIMQERDGMRFQQPVKYPYILVPDPAEASYLIDDASPLPFVAPLEVVPTASSAIQTQVIARSSEQSQIAEPPYDLNPLRKWEWAEPANTRRPVVVEARHRGARILVAGTSHFLSDAFASKATAVAASRLADWLVLDDDLVDLRTTQPRTAP